MSFLKYLAMGTVAVSATVLAVVSVPLLGTIAAVSMATTLGATACLTIEGVSRINTIPVKPYVIHNGLTKPRTHTTSALESVDIVGVASKSVTSMIVVGSLTHLWMLLVAEATTGLAAAAALAVAPAWVGIAGGIIMLTGIVLILGWSANKLLGSPGA